MMKQMRENTKVVLWIVVVAFLVTIFAVWGLDLQTGGISDPQGPANVGKINGTVITPQTFQNVYGQLVDQYRNTSPDGRVSTAQQQRLQDQAWESIVTNVLTEGQIDEFGITVSDDEILNFLRTAPPPEIRQYFVDEQGNFDFTAYQAALNNPEADWTAVEQLARQRIPVIKLNQYLLAQVHVSNAEVKRRWEEENTRMVARYVSFSIDEESMEGYTPSDEEIQAHYDANIDDFAQDERAVLDYVQIPITPTDEDHEDLVLTINDLRDEILAGEDFATTARTFSETHTSPVGGETGFIGSTGRPEAVMSVVAAMEPETVSEAIVVDNGVYMVKLLEKKTVDGDQQYNIQEIFLRLSAGAITIDALIEKAQAVQARATEARDLKKAAEENNLSLLTTQPFISNFPILGIGFVPSISRFAFANDVGTLSNVLQDDNNYFIVKVVERIDATSRPLEDVRAEISETLIYDRRKQQARRRADGFARSLRANQDMEEAVAQYGFTVTTTDTFTVSNRVGDLPPRSTFAMAALQLSTGSSTPPVESGRNFYVLQVTSRAPFDSDAFQQQAPAIQERIYQQKVQEYITYWYDQLRAKAEIEDYRGRL